MTLTQVATTEVVTAGRDAGVREALDLMDEHNVGSVIITEHDEPIGIVTDRMIAMALREAETVDDLTVGEVMTEDLVTIHADATHFDALEAMSDAAIRRLPIVDDEGSLAGIITLDDLLIITAAEMAHASEIIAEQATPL